MSAPEPVVVVVLEGVPGENSPGPYTVEHAPSLSGDHVTYYVPVDRPEDGPGAKPIPLLGL